VGLGGVLVRRVLVEGLGLVGGRVHRVRKGALGRKVVLARKGARVLGGVLGLVGGRVRLGPQDLQDLLDRLDPSAQLARLD
jgi:hypothetical protein